MNAGITNYAQMFSNTATDPNAKITVNYTSATSSLVDSMIATKASNSNVVKGNQIWFSFIKLFCSKLSKIWYNTKEVRWKNGKNNY